MNEPKRSPAPRIAARWWILLVLLVGVGGALWLLRSPPPVPELRLDAPFANGATPDFGSRSEVQIVVRPQSPTGELEVALYRVEAGGLKRTHVQVVHAAGGAITLSGNGQSFFGTTPGLVELAIGVSNEREVVALDGHAWPAAKGQMPSRWITTTVNYQGDLAEKPSSASAAE